MKINKPNEACRETRLQILCIGEGIGGVLRRAAITGSLLLIQIANRNKWAIELFLRAVAEWKKSFEAL